MSRLTLRLQHLNNTAKRPLSRVYSGQSGVAVLTVLLAIVLLLILSSILFLTARVALERATASSDSAQALNVAESGMETAAGTIIAQGFEAKDSGTLSGTLPGGGEYEVDWTAQTALPWFTMTANGYYPSKADAGATRRISSQVFSINPWDFQYAGGMSGGSVNGDVWVEGPFYVNDLLELSGSAGVIGGPLVIRDSDASGDGDLVLNSNGVDIGTANDGLPLFLDGQVSLPNNPSDYNADPIYNWAPALNFPYVGDSEFKNYRYDYSSEWTGDQQRPTAVYDGDG